MNDKVIPFPTEQLEKNWQRHFNNLFARGREQGLSAEQMNVMLLETFREMGAVEIDGVWQIPGSLPKDWKWPGVL
jgi:hypothetical protein